MVQPSTLKISAQTNVTIHIINLEEKNLLVGSDLVFVGCRRRRDPSQSFKIFASQDAEHFCQPWWCFSRCSAPPSCRGGSRRREPPPRRSLPAARVRPAATGCRSTIHEAEPPMGLAVGFGEGGAESPSPRRSWRGRHPRNPSHRKGSWLSSRGHERRIWPEGREERRQGARICAARWRGSPEHAGIVRRRQRRRG